MPEASWKPRSTSASSARRTDTYDLVSVTLFAGGGLLLSLIVVLVRMNGLL